MKKVSILGSTGSIGTQALEVCDKLGYKVDALSAKSNVKLLSEQVRKFRPERVCIADKNKFSELKSELSDIDVRIYAGEDGLCEIASKGSEDILLNSLVGMVGLKPTVEAIKAKKDIALANKETLVAGGQLVMDLVSKNKINLLPVDSEHSAIFQCLMGNNSKELKKIILTASGGPFFGKNFDDLKKVTLKDALNHPNWSMGNKITIDSATLMNKGLEFIEAAWLFGVKAEQIDIVVHRQSVVHSMVQFVDNSVLAQMGVPDMKIPIQLALTYPNRTECDVKALDLTQYGTLTFDQVDMDTFKCLKLCIDSFKMGGLYPAIANAANEEAVGLFLRGKCKFVDIPAAVEYAMKNVSANQEYTLENIYRVSTNARNAVKDKFLY
jgi:1-deoxy-D-xylulose-5-phosphate reductoisomerase